MSGSLGLTIQAEPPKKLKGDPAMETTENTNLQALREMVGRLVEGCTDEDLLDQVCKLLLPGL